jgi:uncharacterized 2Fe-2S/4Fe-4S cluster protein (DUF4445 family)
MPEAIGSDQCSATFTVIFQPGDVVVPGVPVGETLLRAAARSDVFLPSPCAGAGSCGRCVVQVESGEVKSEPSAKISSADWDRGARLACHSRVMGDVVVRVPEAASEKLGHRKVAQARSPWMRGRLLDASGSSVVERLPVADFPVRLVRLVLLPPSVADRTSDLERFETGLCEKLGVTGVRVRVNVIQRLPEALREADWEVTAVVRACRGGGDKWEVVGVRPGSDGPAVCVAALDLGTTTVWGQMFDVETGRIVAAAAAFNQQIQYGDDVISRMVRAGEPGGKDRLAAAAVATIREVLEEMSSVCDGEPGSIEHVVVAGNTTMISLLLGIDTHHLRMEPYVPPFASLAPVPASALGLGPPVSPAAVVKILPAVGSYVGGDVVAGLLASGIADGDDVCLYLDVGTNGEAVIGNREWLLATSCSAGPAFEGGGLRHGMRAVSGAVESVTVDPATLQVGVLTIDDAPPLGICGSGVIDAVAELLKNGIVLPNGRFDPESDSAGLREAEGRWEFVLVPAEFSATGSDIVLTESDVDNVIRAKAAMFAGVTTLLRAVSLEWTDLKRIVVAGAFGRHLRVAEATAIGLFPELDPERFEFLGNGSLLGARAVALSQRMGERAEHVASLMNNVELSDNAVFHEEYMAAMFLPHTDLTRFPSLGQLLSAGEGANG